MLGSYMEDIGITAKEFEAACTQGKSITGKFHQQLFEQVVPPSFVSFTQQLQVWAADDYEIFKRMMIQKNIDLQMEALELLQQRYKSMTNSK